MRRVPKLFDEDLYRPFTPPPAKRESLSSSVTTSSSSCTGSFDETTVPLKEDSTGSNYKEIDLLKLPNSPEFGFFTQTAYPDEFTQTGGGSVSSFHIPDTGHNRSKSLLETIRDVIGGEVQSRLNYIMNEIDSQLADSAYMTHKESCFSFRCPTDSSSRMCHAMRSGEDITYQTEYLKQQSFENSQPMRRRDTEHEIPRKRQIASDTRLSSANKQADEINPPREHSTLRVEVVNVIDVDFETNNGASLHLSLLHDDCPLVCELKSFNQNQSRAMWGDVAFFPYSPGKALRGLLTSVFLTRDLKVCTFMGKFSCYPDMQGVHSLTLPLKVGYITLELSILDGKEIKNPYVQSVHLPILHRQIANYGLSVIPHGFKAARIAVGRFISLSNIPFNEIVVRVNDIFYTSPRRITDNVCDIQQLYVTNLIHNRDAVNFAICKNPAMNYEESGSILGISQMSIDEVVISGREKIHKTLKVMDTSGNDIGFLHIYVELLSDSEILLLSNNSRSFSYPESPSDLTEEAKLIESLKWIKVTIHNVLEGDGASSESSVRIRYGIYQATLADLSENCCMFPILGDTLENLIFEAIEPDGGYVTHMCELNPKGVLNSLDMSFSGSINCFGESKISISLRIDFGG